MFQYLVNKPSEERVMEIIVDAVKIEQVSTCVVSTSHHHMTTFYFVFNFFASFLFYVHGCFPHMYVCAPHTCLMPMEARKGIKYPGNRVVYGCKVPCGCWK